MDIFVCLKEQMGWAPTRLLLGFVEKNGRYSARNRSPTTWQWSFTARPAPVPIIKTGRLQSERFHAGVEQTLEAVAARPVTARGSRGLLHNQ